MRISLIGISLVVHQTVSRPKTKFDVMDTVQEMIDEHKDQMPTALAKKLLDACMEEANASKRLHKLTWTMINSDAIIVEIEDEPDCATVKLSHVTQTLIVEAVDTLPDHPNGLGAIPAIDLPNHGMVLQSWVRHFTKQPLMPIVMTPSECSPYGRPDRMVVVKSIVPYKMQKCESEDEYLFHMR
jgi:hypothetical protein